MNHVYVVALTSHNCQPFSVAGHRIDFVDADGVFAAIERRSAPPTVSEVELRSQHDVVNAISDRVEALLPVRFGTWIDKHELTNMVGRQKAAIVDALQLVRGRVQMTIRFLSPQPDAVRDRSGERAASGTEYLQARRVAELWMPEEAAALRNAVRDFVVAERVSGGTERGAISAIPARLGSVASLYHLISRDRVPTYRAATQPLECATVVVSGPWPPFAFAPDPWL